ncbi:hypothetical protein LTR70_004528 [Exophiala xenobiotica]|uniref:Ribonuclease H2 subunit B n=1 Tax=Lithohypha guttulata TaxID=1690604 RepID=A0ABR0KQI9_9EURO|nr:hypothetical protein LTR24_000458 [Lithohypha guttulata]KAK5320445.1 hypothetical protein LTR70_004528 [Exophiala xenobiotica]
MVQTRSTSSSPVKKSNKAAAPPPPPPSLCSGTSATTVDKLKTPPGEPLQLVIAPSNVSSNARFISLTSPVDATPKRHLFCPSAGVFELTIVNVPKHDPRSILFALDDALEGTKRTQPGAVSNGYINKNAEYVTATPYDLSFTLLPVVADSGKSNLFQSLDDFLDSNDEIYDLGYIAQKSRALVEEAAEAICDSLEAGDEKMYRYSQEKTIKLILRKAQRVCENGLPASLEEKFVTRALEAPILSVKREESTISISKTESQDSIDSTDASTPSDSFDSQSSAASAALSVVFSESSATSTSTSTSTVTTAPTIPSDPVSEDIKSLQRLLIAFKFITASYLSPTLSKTFLTVLQSPSSPPSPPALIDFTPLTAHLTHLSTLRAQAAASADLSSFTRKRGSLEDDDEAEARAEKKRRLEEEEKRKKLNTSRGVKDLAKVDVKRMKKMSAFFQPKVKAKA